MFKPNSEEYLTVHLKHWEQVARKMELGYIPECNNCREDGTLKPAIKLFWLEENKLKDYGKN